MDLGYDGPGYDCNYEHIDAIQYMYDSNACLGHIDFLAIRDIVLTNEYMVETLIANMFVL